MFRLVLVSALVALASAGPQLWRPRLDGRIVGGIPVDITEYPWQVSLQYYGRHICGGSIIADKWVVTAAHCTDGDSPSALSIRAGSSLHNSGGTVVNVKTIHQNPQYDSWNIDYDMTVLELVSGLSFGSGVQPIALPGDNAPIETGADCAVSGWGTLSEGGSLPTQLQAVIVQVVSNTACNDAYGSGSITDRMMCAAVPGGGKDACQGDSGGPLVIDGELIGIVSWGSGCARPSYPGVYGSVPGMRGYITEVSGL